MLLKAVQAIMDPVANDRSANNVCVRPNTIGSKLARPDNSFDFRKFGAPTRADFKSTRRLNRTQRLLPQWAADRLAAACRPHRVKTLTAAALAPAPTGQIVPPLGEIT